MKKPFIFITGIIFGGITIFIFYEYYIDEIYDSYLAMEHSELEYTSDAAFNDLEPSASRFVQIQNGLVIHRANKEGLIDSVTYKRLKAIFSTRLCINFEDQNNLELSTKMCTLAKQDISLWNKDMGFELFKSQLKEKRVEIKQSRKSNKAAPVDD